jgi:hypothetical protein
MPLSTKTHGRFALTRPPRDNDELYSLVRALWGVTVPRGKTCREHQAPFDWFADSFFAREPQTLVHGSRGLSGKSFAMAALGLTNAVVWGADVNLLGGSLSQSMNLHEAMRRYWDFADSPSYMVNDSSNLQLQLTNGARLRPLTASQKTVRGPHPARLLLDEIDEMEPAILHAAMGQPMRQKNWMGIWIPAQTAMACFTAETEITTDRGQVPIAQVTPQDRVLTREGWKRVTASFCSGYRQVGTLRLADGRQLVCTPEHLFAVGDKWVEAQSLPGQIVHSIGPRLAVCQTQGDRPAQAHLPVPVVLATPDASTGPALTSTGSSDGGVLVSEGVAFGAVSLERVESGRSLTSHRVHAGRDDVHVVGVLASSVSAEMVRDQTLRDQPPDQLIGSAMDVASVGLPVQVPVALDSLPRVVPAGGVQDLSLDHLYTISDPVQVDSFVLRHIFLPVYDLTVEDVPEFYANSILAHNSTYQYANGTFAQERQRFMENNLPLYQWCVAGNVSTGVITRAGTKWVEDVTTDDSVLTRQGFKQVQHVTYMGIKQVMEVRTSDGRLIQVTGDHKVLTADRGWVAARLLRQEDRLLVAQTDTASPLPNGLPTLSAVRVTSVLPGDTVPVYDIGVEGAHEFTANGIVVHNCYRDSANEQDGWLDQETIEQKRREIPAEMWRVEYELGEPSIGNRAFDTESVERMFTSEPGEPVKVGKSYEEYKFAGYDDGRDYVIAADWAKSQDYTVISVWDVSSLPMTLAYWIRVNRRPYPQMIGMFNTLQTAYRAVGIHDATGLGGVVADLIDSKSWGFMMTGAKRDDMLSEFVAAVENDRVRAPRIKTFYNAVKFCRDEDLYSRDGKYHLPDEVCSAALAWKAVSNRFPAAMPIGLPKTDHTWIGRQFENNTEHFMASSYVRRDGEVHSSEETTEIWEMS